MATIHATTGTDRRATHTLSGDGLTFDLTNEIREIEADLSRATGGRSAKTLAKTAGLRVTLVVLDAGVDMMPESAAGAASLQVLQGRVRVQTDGSVHELGPGEMAVVSHNLREPVRAEQRSAFLVTVAWPEGAGAWGEEERTGHH